MTNYTTMKIDTLLLKWYDANARTLPWRNVHDPYKTWVSEIMLQQTRAETVRGYYARFMERFPDVQSLANAEQDEVLKLWEGLGYYSRARNLHACARQIVQLGAFPNTIEGLESLRGIGPYAARAIGSIAFGLCAPALDGNQMRVLSRCLAVDRVLNTPFDLLTEAEALISRDRPGDYNQALMDLGSGVCTAKNPKCAICPLASVCLARAQGEPERYPMRPAPIPKRDENRTVLLLRTEGGICVQRRDERKLLGGLYEFPSLDGHLSADECADALIAAGYARPRNFESLPPAKHVFTHLIWHMQGWTAEIDTAPDGILIADAARLCALAFPSALRVYRKIAQSLDCDA